MRYTKFQFIQNFTLILEINLHLLLQISQLHQKYDFISLHKKNLLTCELEELEYGVCKICLSVCMKNTSSLNNLISLVHYIMTYSFLHLLVFHIVLKKKWGTSKENHWKSASFLQNLSHTTGEEGWLEVTAMLLLEAQEPFWYAS